MFQVPKARAFPRSRSCFASGSRRRGVCLRGMCFSILCSLDQMRNTRVTWENQTDLAYLLQTNEIQTYARQISFSTVFKNDLVFIKFSGKKNWGWLGGAGGMSWKGKQIK